MKSEKAQSKHIFSIWSPPNWLIYIAKRHNYSSDNVKFQMVQIMSFHNSCAGSNTEQMV